MDATVYYDKADKKSGLSHMNYIWYTKEEVLRRAKWDGLGREANSMSVYWADGNVQHFERRKSRWYIL